MPIEVSSTANSITEVLLAGDAVLNLTQQPLNTIAGTQFIHASSDGVQCHSSAAHVVWQHSFLFSLLNLSARRVSRIVVVSEEGCSDAEFIVRELEARNISHLHCSLMSNCNADSFMDEQDAEAVTERLRQLGYI
jgi:hypothetical protein